MSRNTVYQGQSFLDKVIECTGDISNAFAMARQNGIMDITATLEVGTALKSPTPTRPGIVELFGHKNRPATALAIEEEDYSLPGEFPISF